MVGMECFESCVHRRYNVIRAIRVMCAVEHDCCVARGGVAGALVVPCTNFPLGGSNTLLIAC